MARFKCTKEDCPLKNKEVIVPQLRWVWSNEKQKLIATPSILCEECKSELEHLPNTEMPIVHFNQFDSLSSDQKRKVIQKRSSDHMRKTGENKDIAERKRQIIADNKRMVTGGR